MEDSSMRNSSSPPLHIVVLFGFTIFLSSFLLFLIQPVFAKLILPWFGGAAGVWITCLVFFQVALLLGYLYAHFVAERLAPRSQALLHIGLLAASLFVLPVIPGPAWKPGAGDDPALRILALLTVVLGLPYFLLSTTGPLLQSWYSRRWPDSQPYRMFALSNAGALIALCSYPVWIEPRLATRTQDGLWSIAFAGFAIFCAQAAWIGMRPRGSAGEYDSSIEEVPAGEAAPAAASAQKNDAEQSDVAGAGADEDSPRTEPAPAAFPFATPDPATTVFERPPFPHMVIWTALAAGGSMLLLSTTNQLTQNIAAVPLLWILPLAIYLLTFTLCFESHRWYRRPIFLRLLAVALGSVGYTIYDIDMSAAIPVAVPVFSIGLFLCCMFCHGELSCLKPEGRYLTTFYLTIALGGALGAVFVGLIAPAAFPGIYELPLSLLFIAALALQLNWQDGLLPRLLWGSVTVAMAIVLISEIRGYHKDTVVMTRNFYGALRVVESSEGGSEVYTLYHGTIEHGAEFLSPRQRMNPTSYYGPESGAGLALRYETNGPKRVGIVGLGAGTLSAYGQPGDLFHFYEINPQVLELARSEFSFLRESAAKVEVTLGDARLSLEAEAPQQFDVLVVDAFSGDAIPVHLLTREAFALYLRHLKPEGILAVHVSNQYLDLAPVVQQLASFYGYPAVLIRSAKDEQQLISAASWVLMTQNRAFLGRPEVANAAQPIPPRRGLRLWTDDYNSLLQVIRWM
jgi:SAM-dependent methyltransferase